ncbi:MAG TPA: TIM barrel protein [Vicinamibacterales bacterium]|nr:TIM barrel protein [Vicinamibacterales bacterium]
MSDTTDNGRGLDRRDFFKTAGAGLTAAGLMLTPREQLIAQERVEKDRLARIASNSYPIRYIFKSRPGGGRGAGAGAAGRGAGAPPNAAGGAPPRPAGPNPARGLVNAGVSSEEMKKKYGEITMLDFPQWTKDTFPGVTHMDIFSGLFGDVTDDSMFAGRTFDPSTPSGKKWLDTLAAKLVATGTKVQHISNNAPNDLAGPDEALRKAGVEVGKKWLDGAAIVGAKSVRMNSPRALGPSIRPQAAIDPKNGYPKNDEIMPYLKSAIESYKEMADYGGNLGIRVTLENHWGLAADPINIRTIIDEVNSPYCEASPDFCNWEYDYMLVSGLKALAPYSHTNVHAKYWDRWGEKNDVQRSVRIMLSSGFRGTFALEYEEGPLNGVEGAKYLYKEVLAALTTPTPVI